jgi:ferrous iron transport protein A
VSVSTPRVSGALSPALPAVTLGGAAIGARGTVLKVGLDESVVAGGLEASELERRLLEIGFVEGARFEILHQGLFGRDPIAVQLDDMTVALRRREASAVLVLIDQEHDAIAYAVAAE